MRKISQDRTLIAYRGLDETTYNRERTIEGLASKKLIVTPNKQLAARSAAFTDTGIPKDKPVIVKVQLSYNDVIPATWNNEPIYIVKGGFIPKENILSVEGV
jgi:hypothetical protein